MPLRIRIGLAAYLLLLKSNTTRVQNFDCTDVSMARLGNSRKVASSSRLEIDTRRLFEATSAATIHPSFSPVPSGSRPGRSCHDAIRAVHKHLYRYDVQTVLDVDLANFCGTIDHALLLNVLKEKIDDQRLIRYLTRMFKAGVLAEGDLSVSEEGMPQRSGCSPVLANVFAHYAIDDWFDTVCQSTLCWSLSFLVKLRTIRE